MGSPVNRKLPAEIEQRAQTKSELARPRIARVRNRVTNVLDCRNVAHETFEPKAIARMWNRAKAPQVQVPPVILGIESELAHLLLQHLEALLSLTHADELAHPGHEQIARRHSLAVLVITHIEGLDVSGV